MKLNFVYGLDHVTIWMHYTNKVLVQPSGVRERLVLPLHDGASVRSVGLFNSLRAVLL